VWWLIISTLYSAIYDVFLEKITDFDFVSLSSTDLELQLKCYLKGAIQNFLIYCEQDLKLRSDTTATFNITLTDMEIEILAMLMVPQWLNPQINSQQLLKEKFGDREYNLFSSSSLLKQVKDLRDSAVKEANDMIAIYYYSNLS
jgi:hypothetical protein